MKGITLISMMFLLLTVSFGQVVLKNNQSFLVPKLLNYQGYLTDNQGNPINNPSLAMTFSIYDASGAGSLKWTENQNVKVEKGIFNVTLGSVTSIPDTVFTGGVNRWLELTAGGQILTPRTRITAMGYAYASTYSDTALYAKNAAADNDWIISGSDMYSGVSGNVGVGVTTPRYKLDVNGAICGGTGDTVNAVYGGILSGYSNLAGDAGADTAAAVAGGWDNSVTGKFGFAGGGRANTARGPFAAVGGGYADTASGDYAIVGGGSSNTADTTYAAVCGGRRNRAGGYSATVGGGYTNTASGNYATVSGGYSNEANYLYSTVGGGYNNTADTNNATVGGGYNNTASGNTATVSGGSTNTASGYRASVGGGYSNSADSSYAFIGGGNNNTASGNSATVAGGVGNTASNSYATIGGGNTNEAESTYATVGGGFLNRASGAQSSVGGGMSNTASGNYATVAGGYSNSAESLYTFVGGGNDNSTRSRYATVAGGNLNIASGYSAAVSGGSSNIAEDSSAFVGGGRFNRARGKYAAVCGGGGPTATDSNLANGMWSVVVGGRRNTADSTYAFVGGGYINTAVDDYATVVGGYSNYAGGNYTTVGGGYNNTADSAYATVGGGYSNVAAAYRATVGGGYSNNASGSYSTIPGGYNNTAYGNMSLAAGYNAYAAHRGSFVWADSSSSSLFSSTTANQFRVRAVGGIDLTGNVAVRNTAGTIVVELGEGLDYAEGFDVLDGDAISPGVVLIIDADNPGKLRVSDKPYDTRVAGIAAGASSLGSGVRLGGDRFDCNVALAGRVYCNVDAHDVGVEPGDLLTTSATPGHAMKVSDRSCAQGAILGKAMQKLEKGQKGQILVLVTLQ